VSETAAAPTLSLAGRAPYPERVVTAPRWPERLWHAVAGAAVTRGARLRTRRLWPIVPLVEDAAAGLSRLDDAQLRAQARSLSLALRGTGIEDPARVARAFALVREAATRHLGMRHFDVQLMGGHALVRGMVAEMATGEGKTLTATLAAATAALAGTPVHVVTVNDYLAERDAAWMAPVYEALGLRVGVAQHGQRPEERRSAYRADVTYVTNKEIAFDYLRDRITLGSGSRELSLRVRRLSRGGSGGEPLLRGLPFAIVDEADSVLIDEARTPLIISGEAAPDERVAMGERALELARAMEPGRHFVVHSQERRLELTRAGSRHAAELAWAEEGLWQNEVLREELVRLALSALHLFHPGEAYLVQEGKVQIVDEFTGRIMADRSWSEGLHQLIELKEGLEPSRPRVPVARITYQRFFRRYRRLAGMTGTAAEVARELWAVFRLELARIPTHRPVCRRVLPDRICADAEAKWRAIAARCAELHAEGRPVLLGTRSVAASETASRHLAAAGLPHRVLSAAQDRDEAAIVAEAGLPGRITVATNMAGRGTDIRLGPGVAERGGLYVIMSERHEAGRIDRQLAGRCARQGEPGTIETILAWDDPLLAHLGAAGGRLPRVLGRIAYRVAQRRAERAHARLRKRLLAQDERLGTLLAFSGPLE
jgi:preprotein translocase subunit SecA